MGVESDRRRRLGNGGGGGGGGGKGGVINTEGIVTDGVGVTGNVRLGFNADTAVTGNVNGLGVDNDGSEGLAVGVDKVG